MVNHQYAFVQRGSMVSIVAYLNLHAHSVHSVPATSYAWVILMQSEARVRGLHNCGLER